MPDSFSSPRLLGHVCPGTGGLSGISRSNFVTSELSFKGIILIHCGDVERKIVS